MSIQEPCSLYEPHCSILTQNSTTTQTLIVATTSSYRTVVPRNSSDASSDCGLWTAARALHSSSSSSSSFSSSFCSLSFAQLNNSLFFACLSATFDLPPCFVLVHARACVRDCAGCSLSVCLSHDDGTKCKMLTWSVVCVLLYCMDVV